MNSSLGTASCDGSMVISRSRNLGSSLVLKNHNKKWPFMAYFLKSVERGMRGRK